MFLRRMNAIPQSHWKPSEVHISALEVVCKEEKPSYEEYAFLEELLEQLKAL